MEQFIECFGHTIEFQKLELILYLIY